MKLKGFRTLNSNSQAGVTPPSRPILEDLVLIFGLLLKSLEVRALIYDEISPNIHQLFSEYLVDKGSYSFSIHSNDTMELCTVNSLTQFLKKHGRECKKDELQFFIMRLTKNESCQYFTSHQLEEFLFKESCIHFYPPVSDEISSERPSAIIKKKPVSRSKSAKSRIKKGKKANRKGEEWPTKDRRSIRNSSKSDNQRKSYSKYRLKFNKRVNSDAILLKPRFTNFTNLRSKSPHISRKSHDSNTPSYLRSYLNSTKKGNLSRSNTKSRKKSRKSYSRSKTPKIKSKTPRKSKSAMKKGRRKYSKNRSPFRTLDDENRPSYKMRGSYDSQASYKTHKHRFSHKPHLDRGYAYYLKQLQMHKYWKP